METQNHIDTIKSAIKEFYDNKTPLNVYVKTTHTPSDGTLSPAIITGVYNNLFLIDIKEDGTIKHQSFTYSDVLIGQIEFKELDYKPQSSQIPKEDKEQTKQDAEVNNEDLQEEPGESLFDIVDSDNDEDDY